MDYRHPFGGALRHNQKAGTANKSPPPAGHSYFITILMLCKYANHFVAMTNNGPRGFSWAVLLEITVLHMSQLLSRHCEECCLRRSNLMSGREIASQKALAMTAG
jgi:hypothetical protein